MGEGELKGQKKGRDVTESSKTETAWNTGGERLWLRSGRGFSSSVNSCIIWCAIVLLRANASLREIVVVDGLSIRGPRGASYIDRLQIDKHADTHTHAHTYVHRAA